MIGVNDFEKSLKLETERLCLDFTNTVNWHASEHPVEELPAYTHLLAWAQNVGLLPQPETQRLSRLAARRPAKARAVLERAHALREALFRLQSTTSPRGAPLPGHVDAINTALPRSLARSRRASA